MGHPLVVLGVVAVAVAGVGLVVFSLWRRLGRMGEEVEQRRLALETARANAQPATGTVIASDPLPSELRDQHGFGANRAERARPS